MASSKMAIEKMEFRQGYSNVWHTELMDTMNEDCAFCCYAAICAPCASYGLRKRALYNDMSSDELQELARILDCIADSVYCTVCACMQTQHKLEMDKRDGKFGPQPVMLVPPIQQMSRMDQPIPPTVGYPPPPAAAGVGQPYYPPPPLTAGYPVMGYPPPPPGPLHHHPNAPMPPQEQHPPSSSFDPNPNSKHKN
ncbi:trithorax group protein osa-like [Senna tora]|uniref:Trithorax group protein osa-like n=1 Tax=Senna tora TaxID=362788 RepID=A0A834W6T2_9FABA|nr:trithorax group protein osa-like [Senna tora]